MVYAHLGLSGVILSSRDPSLTSLLLRSSGSGPAAKSLLGGKGANLAEMSTIGLSVPPGFTVTTECYDGYCNRWNSSLPPSLWNEILTSRQFGSSEEPLLLSVRSGAAISMPGMMDTVLNLGMNGGVCEGLAKETGNERFAWDSYRRFLEMFGERDDVGVLFCARFFLRDWGRFSFRNLGTFVRGAGDLDS